MRLAMATIAAAKARDRHVEPPCCQKLRDDHAFMPVRHGEGVDGVGDAGQPVDMPVQALVAPKMTPQTCADPAGAIGVAGVDVISGAQPDLGVKRSSGASRRSSSR